MSSTVLGSVPGELGTLLKLLLDLILYVYGEQLRSYKDGQLLSHTVPRQASRRQFTSILSPITAGQLALLEPAERFFFPRNNVQDARVDLGVGAYEADTLPTEQPCPVSSLTSSRHTQ